MKIAEIKLGDTEDPTEAIAEINEYLSLVGVEMDVLVRQPEETEEEFIKRSSGHRTRGRKCKGRGRMGWSDCLKAT